MKKKLKKLWKVRLSGTGGQGLITASIILADALIMDGENVVQSQSYGAEARGGASRGEVIVSNGDESILYPKIDTPNVLLCMSPEALTKHFSSLDPEGVLILDSTMIREAPKTEAALYQVPITDMARDEVGSVIAANIVALGVIAGITHIVSEDFLIKAVKKNLSKKFFDVNKKAVDVGIEAGERLLK